MNELAAYSREYSRKARSGHHSHSEYPGARAPIALLVVHFPHDDLLVGIVPSAELDLAAWIGRSGEPLQQVQRRSRKRCRIDPIVLERGLQHYLPAVVACR